MNKSFREQFCECKAKQLVVQGEFVKYREHPEWLPAPWHPAAPKFKAILEKDPEYGFHKLMCKRFGGECCSSNPPCYKERYSYGITEKSETQSEKT